VSLQSNEKVIDLLGNDAGETEVTEGVIIPHGGITNLENGQRVVVIGFPTFISFTRVECIIELTRSVIAFCKSASRASITDSPTSIHTSPPP